MRHNIWGPRLPACFFQLLAVFGRVSLRKAYKTEAITSTCAAIRNSSKVDMR